MRLGLFLPVSGRAATRGTLMEAARQAEEWGFDSVWAADRIVIPWQIDTTYPYNESASFFVPPDRPFLEALTTMAFLAGCTERVRLGVSVVVLPYRNPLYWAKVAATIDVLSEGRVVLGVGIGWMREEFDALGFSHTFDKRGVATDEAIKIFRSAWTTNGPVEHHGDAYDFDPVLMWPKPARAGGLPIWIGGHGRRSIRRAAELGDGWQPLRISVEELSHHIAYLREQLARYGRRPEDVTVSLGVSALPPTSQSGAPAEEWELAGDPDACAARLKRYAAAGVEHFLVNCPRGASTAAMLEAYEFIAREVRPRVEAAR
jgi:probable F420-dependent oxidoreductase